MVDADKVYSEDKGSGASDGDLIDAANINTFHYASGFTDFVRTGLDFTVDFGNNTFDLSEGLCIISETTVSMERNSEVNDQGNSFFAMLTSRSGKSLTDNATNDIFVDLDLSADDSISIAIKTSGTPTQPYLKIGTIDTSGDTTTRLNRMPPVPTGYLKFLEKSSDPDDPESGQSILWQSDGTGSGDDGDIIMKITDSGGTTKTATIVDFSSV